MHRSWSAVSREHRRVCIEVPRASDGCWKARAPVIAPPRVQLGGRIALVQLHAIAVAFNFVDPHVADGVLSRPAAAALCIAAAEQVLLRLPVRSQTLRIWQRRTGGGTSGEVYATYPSIFLGLLRPP
jgi:hypothetical protein